MSGSELWLRRLNFGLYKPSHGQSVASGIDLSELHVWFKIEQVMWGTPWSLDATIINVGEALIDQLIREYSRVVVSAGYQQPAKQYGPIFDGNVVQYWRGRLNATDNYLRVAANGWDQAFTQAVVNTVIPAGHTQQDVINACLDAMKPYGVEPGQTTDLGDAKSPRARALTGMAMDNVRDVAQTADVKCHIADGKLNMLKQSQTLPSKAFVLNSRSGMIGVPHQTLGMGLEVTSLLNPSIRPGVMIQIDQKSIVKLSAPQTAPQGIGATPEQQMQIDLTAKVSSDGFYRVFAVTHHGDNRGNPWFSEIRTEPLDPTKMGPTLG